MSPRGVLTVARQEFRLRIRAGRWRWLLGAWFVVLLLFTLLVRLGIGNIDDEELAGYTGTILFGSLMLFVLGLALLVVPALAAQSVNGDRERGTLATLQVTRLSALEITLGKFVAAWGTALVFLALTLPLVVYAMTQGGVPASRVPVVLLIVAVLLATVCALSLALSSLLARTTTSGVLAYVSVFALTLGTLILFGLGTAMTAESYTETSRYCVDGEPVPFEPTLPDDEPVPQEFACDERTETYQATRPRTDRVWWLLAPNPFVVLADASPRLPPEDRGTQREAGREISVEEPSARDLDPLGQLGNGVRGLRLSPDEQERELQAQQEAEEVRGPAVWPTGLLIHLALTVGALALTARRLRTPTRKLAKGMRVA